MRLRGMATSNHKLPVKFPIRRLKKTDILIRPTDYRDEKLHRLPLSFEIAKKKAFTVCKTGC